MKKLLAICAAVALFSGDCVWGMGEDESRENLLQQTQRSRVQKIRQIASKGIQKAKNLFKRKKFQTQATQTTDSIPIEQIPINSRQVEENMDRLVKHEPDHYTLFHYEKMQNSAADEGFSTPTEIVTYPNGDPKIWSDISEIRYANDVSYDKLENPKVILYRNKDNSCYIILRIQENKHGVFYGINESHIKLGGRSFSVYDVSEDMGSFIDGVARMIYVDESGLYFVPAAGNSVEDVIDSYQKGGKFNFKGSVIKVSAIDGTIIWNGNAITEDNFFDNWVLENHKIILSTKQPGEKEVLSNFYPPEGSYKGILGANYKFVTDTIPGGVRTHTLLGWLNAYGIPNKVRENPIIDLKDRNWFSAFITSRLQLAEARNKNGAEKLVKNGTFSSILSLPKELFTPSGSMFGSDLVYYQKVYGAVAAQIVPAENEQRLKLGLKPIIGATPESVSEMVSQNPTLFKNPDFVRKLKPAFKELEKDYEHNKESEMWILFEIVRNL